MVLLHLSHEQMLTPLITSVTYLAWESLKLPSNMVFLRFSSDGQQESLQKSKAWTKGIKSTHLRYNCYWSNKDKKKIPLHLDGCFTHKHTKSAHILAIQSGCCMHLVWRLSSVWKNHRNIDETSQYSHKDDICDIAEDVLWQRLLQFQPASEINSDHFWPQIKHERYRNYIGTQWNWGKKTIFDLKGLDKPI